MNGGLERETKMEKTISVGFIGVGNMASQLVRSVRQSNPHARIRLNTLSLESIRPFAEEMEAELASISQVIQSSDYIFVGVKPYQLVSLFDSVEPELLAQSQAIWISMAAGVSLDELAKLTPSPLKWIRIMPNLAVGHGQGVVSVTPSSVISDSELANFLFIIKGTGLVKQLDESLFDIFTGIAGSSPAYLFVLIEAMSDVGVHYGLTRQDAVQIAAQTVKGAADMVLRSETSPAVLKDQVTSPQGTTIAGLLKLEETGFRSAIIEAITAATERFK